MPATPRPEHFDLFVSYASADRPRVEQLVAALQQRNVQVWWDAGQLTLGDSLSRKIDEGLTNSRYGLVIISDAFLKTRWPDTELRHLLSRSTAAGRKIILPVRLDLSHSQLSAHYPSLADIVTAEFGTDVNRLTDDILRAIHWDPAPESSSDYLPVPTPPRPPSTTGTPPGDGTATNRTPQRHVVFLLHGIRTHAEWATRAADILQSDPSISSARLIGYEYFDIVRFLTPGHLFRRKPVERVTKLIRDELSRPHTTVSVIAHSFGTYIVGRILQAEPDIRLQRLILCGSILPDSFDWTRICQTQLPVDRSGNSHVVNDCGMLDIWPVLAKSVTPGYGSSGRFGFAHNRVQDRFFPVAHSGFFAPHFIKKYWLPFLTNGDIVRGALDRASTPLWVSAFTIVKVRYLLLAFLLLAAFSAPTPLRDIVDFFLSRLPRPEESLDRSDLPPQAPATLRTVAGDRTVTLRWEPGPGNGAPITRWDYRYRVASDSTWLRNWTAVPEGTARTSIFIATGLTNGVQYAFQVRAVSRSTPGTGSSLQSATPAGPPFPPTVAARPADSRVLLTWQPSSNNGAPVLRWQYRYRPSAVSTWTLDWTDVPGSDAQTDEFTIAPLTNGRRYTFQVRAVNRAGTGGASSPAVAAPVRQRQPVASLVDTARLRALQANDLTSQGDAAAAVAVALSAMPQRNGPTWPSIEQIPEVRLALIDALMQRREVHVLRGHTSWVVDAGFSPTRDLVVTASYDGTARLWDSGTGAPIGPPIDIPLRPAVLSSSFSPDGLWLLTTSSGNTRRTLLWNVDSPRNPAALSGHDSAVNAAAFSPDPTGRFIVTGSHDTTARVWSRVTRAPLTTLGDHLGSVRGVAFAPDFSEKGGRILTASDDRTARLWTLIATDDGFTVADSPRLLGEHPSYVTDAVFSPTAPHDVVTASGDGTVHFWDGLSGRAISRPLKAHSASVEGVSFSPDGLLLATASRDGTARIWDFETQQEIAVLRGHERRQGNDNHVDRVAFSPGGNLVVTASYDRTARVWDALKGADLTLLRPRSRSGTVRSLEPYGQRVLSPRAIETAAFVHGADTTNPQAVVALGFSTGGSWSDRAWWVWSDASDNTPETFRLGGTLHGQGVLSPDGRKLFLIRDGTPGLFSTLTGERVLSLSATGSHVTRAAFSPDGLRIVTAQGADRLRIWDAVTGEELYMTGLIDPTYEVEAVALCTRGDGAALATGAVNDYFQIWDAETGAEVAELQGEGGVQSVVFSPDCTYVVTATNGGARIWNAATGTPEHTLAHDTGWVSGARFSTDGSRVVTVSQDGAARIWDANSGTIVALLRGHEDAVLDARFSPDDSRILTASRDGTVIVWPHYRTDDMLVRHAQELVERLAPLSQRERCEYGIEVEGCEDSR